jgi:hypothetical protein
MGTRQRAKSDTRVEQGKRRDAYFAQLRKAAQPKARPAESKASAEKPE